MTTTPAYRGRLVLLGSGETAPTMVEMHRGVLSSAGAGRVVMLDSSYGFQENAEALTDKARAYFEGSVGRAVTPIRWRRRLEGAGLDGVLTAIRTARAVYAGPGSPSYAVRVWADSGFAEAVATVIAAGGTGTRTGTACGSRFAKAGHRRARGPGRDRSGRDRCVADRASRDDQEKAARY